jgi:hypothetical protein
VEKIYETEVIPAEPNQMARFAIIAVAVVLVILSVVVLWKMH